MARPSLYPSGMWDALSDVLEGLTLTSGTDATLRRAGRDRAGEVDVTEGRTFVWGVPLVIERDRRLSPANAHRQHRTMTRPLIIRYWGDADDPEWTIAQAVMDAGTIGDALETGPITGTVAQGTPAGVRWIGIQVGEPSITYPDDEAGGLECSLSVAVFYTYTAP